jgi:hypothetical protein
MQKSRLMGSYPAGGGSGADRRYQTVNTILRILISSRTFSIILLMAFRAYSCDRKQPDIIRAMRVMATDATQLLFRIARVWNP